MNNLHAEMKVRELLETDIPNWINGAHNFRSLLFDLFSKADSLNRHNLSKGFPLEYEAFKRWEQSSDGN